VCFGTAVGVLPHLPYFFTYIMGWIKIDRTIVDHWLWSDEKKLKWWLTLLMEVNYTDSNMSLGYKVYRINKGQSSYSIRTWANIFKTGTKSVTKFFEMLELDGLITKKTIGKGKQSTTLLTVCKHDSYGSIGYDLETQGDTQDNTQGDTQGDTQEAHNKKREEDKKEKKEKGIPTLEEVIDHVVSSGYDQSIAEKFYDYYQKITPSNARLWRDKNGNTVKNWKSKLTHVWFKDAEKRDVNVPVVEPGWRYVDMSEAYDIIRGQSPVALSEKEVIGAGDDYVRKMMNINPSYHNSGNGWKYRKTT
jgi:hypothetical protein